MSETPESCIKSINEPCALHPVDCENCKRNPGCQMSEVMRANPGKIKRCRFFRRRPGQRIL